MELTPEHRRALLLELDKALEDERIQLHCLKALPESEHLKMHWEVGDFLAKQRIKTITQALIDNQLDNY